MTQSGIVYLTRELTKVDAIFKSKTESWAEPEAVGKAESESMPEHCHIETKAKAEAEKWVSSGGSQVGAGIGIALESKSDFWPELIAAQYRGDGDTAP